MVTTSQTPPQPFTLVIGDDPVYSLDTDRRRIGIGTRLPQRRLHLVAPDAVVARFESTGAASPQVEFRGSGGSGTLSYDSATGQWVLGTDLEATDSKLAVDVLSVPDGGASAARIAIGTDGDLKLFFDGTASNVSAGGSQLILTGAGGVTVRSAGGATALSINTSALVTCSKGLTVNTTAASDSLKVNDSSGRVAVSRSVADAQMHIRQNSGVAAIAVLELEQNDQDEPFLELTGTSAASSAANISTWTTGATLTGYVRIAINGTDYWMPYYTAPTS